MPHPCHSGRGMEQPTGGTFTGVPSIEVDDVTMEKLRYEADRRGISVERMTKAIVVTGFADVDERIAAAASRDRSEPSPEFVERARQRAREHFAELRVLHEAGWPSGVRF